ncbi:MAG: hypothetical protein V1735_03885 [Nanoarchaeota archaeon]
MGFFSKLGLGKKDDLGDFDLGKDVAAPPPMGLDTRNDLGLPPSQPTMTSQPSFSPPESDFGFSPQGMPSSFRSQPQAPPPMPGNQDYIVSKEIELISSKLDSLRSSLETVNARLANLERMVENDQQRRRW